MFGLRKKSTEPSFYIYYGPGTGEALKRLRNQSVLFLELRQWKPADLTSLRAGGTRIYGYLPVMESPVWNEQRIHRLSENDYWLHNGQRIYFDKWDSYLMDLRSPAYRKILLDEWAEMQKKWPIDGILLDTVGDIEEFIPIEQQQEISRDYRSLLAVATSRFPDLKTIQNRGFMQLDCCSSLLHGILWEDWRAEWINHPAASSWIGHLRMLSRSRGFTVFAVSSLKSGEHAESARKLGFLHQQQDTDYNRIPEI